MKKYLILIIIFASCFFLNAQSISANQLIQKSIEYHNPEDDWKHFNDTLHIKQETPDKTIRFRKILIDKPQKYFEFEGKYEDGKLQYKVLDNASIVMWNGSQVIPEDLKSKYRISEERALMYRNYYSYLYGMPMKLNDPGTIIHQGVTEVNFHGKEYFKIKVSYQPNVGMDTWFFYFNKNTYALGAYEFYKKNPRDGEYLLLDGIKIISGVKLATQIAWYMTKGDKWLGNDILE